MTNATVLTDASYCPTSKCGGWAAWVRVDGHSHPYKHFGRIRKVGMPDSTEAEVYAALNGIWIARQRGAQYILLRTDCLAVVHLVENTAKSARLRAMWWEAMSRPDMVGVALRATHIKGHTAVRCRASYVNNWCDRMARQAMRRFRKDLNSGATV